MSHIDKIKQNVMNIMRNKTISTVYKNKEEVNTKEKGGNK